MADEQTATPEEVESQPTGTPASTDNVQPPAAQMAQAAQAAQPVQPTTSTMPDQIPDPLDNHPAVQQAGVIRRVGETIAGGPRIKTTIDPQTGTVTREKVPLSTGEILKGALANILGGLGQAGNAYVASRQGRPNPAPQPLPTQAAAQQRAQQSQADFEQQQQTKVQQAKVLTA